MAEGAVGFVLNKIDNLLIHEGRLLSGIQSGVEDIKDELESMQAFLMDADLKEEDDVGVKTWAKQVRDVAYDIEDALDEFMLLAGKQTHPSNRFIRFLCKTAEFVQYWKARHQIANQIQTIKNRVHTIHDRSQRYQFNRLDHQASSSTYKPDPRGDDALFVNESELVGIKERRDDMQGLLLDGDPKLKVVSVVGMAGLGKTTLVKKVYDIPGVKESFQCHAWIIVSQSFQIEQILRDMLKQLFGEIKQPTPQVVETMNRVGLKEVLKEFLRQKRYVIVFDDIWSTDAWDDLKHALPDDNNCSRIMITTRIADVASYSSRSVEDIYRLEPLNPKDAWDLFCMKAFRSDSTCPSGLQLLSEKLLSKCGGLPLAIVVISSLLSTKDKIEEWQSVLYSLHTQIESNSKLHNMMNIIMLSFNNLPYYLKSCFLYLSIFPEDYQFKRTKLIRLWVGEGFIEQKHGSNAEDVAEIYFNELVNRSFIQAIRHDTFRVCKVKWQVHDLIHEIILHKSHAQNFATILASKEQSVKVLNSKIRHLSIHKSNDRLLISWNARTSFSHLRSLLLFDISSPVPTFSWDAFRLLKVLDLENAPLEVFPEEIVRLLHLTVLNLKRTKIKTIPPSIGMLSKLETLNLEFTFITKLPYGILKLRQLRHLIASNWEKWHPDLPARFGFLHGFMVPNGIGDLEFLQTLKVVENTIGTNIARELGRLTQLKKLHIGKLRREDGIHLCASIEKMTNLRCLCICAAEEEEMIDMESFTPPSPLLRQIGIQGRLSQFPRWISSLNNLEKLYLGWSRFMTDPLEALQALPRLVELILVKTYDGEQLCFQERGFQKLLALYLCDMERLRLVSVEEGALPSIQYILIAQCAMFGRVPIGVEGLNNLKQLNFIMPHPELVETLHPVRGQDHWRVSHIPSLGVWCRRGEKWECSSLVRGKWEVQYIGAFLCMSYAGNRWNLNEVYAICLPHKNKCNLPYPLQNRIFYLSCQRIEEAKGCLCAEPLQSD